MRFVVNEEDIKTVRISTETIYRTFPNESESLIERIHHEIMSELLIDRPGGFASIQAMYNIEASEVNKMTQRAELQSVGCNSQSIQCFR